MQSFKEFFYRKILQESADQLLFEYEVYRLIPGTKNSYRQDSGNTNTLTQQHSHVFAKSHGKVAQLYAVNIDGSGRDGSSGTAISSLHADYFRSLGYSIPTNNILESIGSTRLELGDYTVLILDDSSEDATQRFIRLLTEGQST